MKPLFILSITLLTIVSALQISSFGQSQPPVSTTAPTVVKVTIPESLSVGGPEVAYRQTESGIGVTIKFNRDWVQVVQSIPADLPTGWYRRQGKLPAYWLVQGDQLEAQTKIEFQENNNRFVFQHGTTQKTYDRVTRQPTASTPEKGLLRTLGG